MSMYKTKYIKQTTNPLIQHNYTLEHQSLFLMTISALGKKYNSIISKIKTIINELKVTFNYTPKINALKGL